MHPITLFTQDQIEEYVPKIQDKTAASMMLMLLHDVNHLENQVRLQKERMNYIHDNLQKYSDGVINSIMRLPGKCSRGN